MADAAPAARGAMGFLGSTIPGTPIPIWLVVVAGGVGAAFVLPKFLNRTTTDQTTTNAGTAQADPTAGGQIDPYTSVPYSVENAINPKTGLPSYFDLFPPTSQGQTGNQPPPSQTFSCPPGTYVDRDSSGQMVCRISPRTGPPTGPPTRTPPNAPPNAPPINPPGSPGPIIPRPLPNTSQWATLNGMTGRQ